MNITIFKVSRGADRKAVILLRTVDLPIPPAVGMEIYAEDVNGDVPWSAIVENVRVRMFDGAQHIEVLAETETNTEQPIDEIIAQESAAGWTIHQK